MTRAHVIAWRDDLAQPRARRQPRSGTASRRCRRCSNISAKKTPSPTIRSKASSGRRAESGEGKTPAIGDHQARELLAAPGEETIKDKRDRAILSTLLLSRAAARGAVQAQGQGFQARAARRAASEGRRQGREDPVSAAASGHQRADPRLPRGRRPRRGRERRAVPADPQQPHRPARQGARRPTGSTSWSGDIQRSSASRSAPMRCARRPPPTRSTTRPTSPRCRSGSATPTSPPPASTITARRGRRTARRSRSRIESGLTERTPPISSAALRQRLSFVKFSEHRTPGPQTPVPPKRLLRLALERPDLFRKPPKGEIKTPAESDVQLIHKTLREARLDRLMPRCFRRWHRSRGRSCWGFCKARQRRE